MPSGNQSGLDKFLFGQASALLPRDIWVMALLVAAVLTTVGFLYKELKLVTFDREFAAAIGRPVRGLEILLTTLLVTVVVIGLQTVGVVLIVATLITPAAAARQWTERLGHDARAVRDDRRPVRAHPVRSGRRAVERLPTGPVIVLCSSAVLVFSLLFGKHRGILWSALQQPAVWPRASAPRTS